MLGRTRGVSLFRKRVRDFSKEIFRAFLRICLEENGCKRSQVNSDTPTEGALR